MKQKIEQIGMFFFAMLLGVILGQTWAYMQKKHRDSMCTEYGLYCDNCIQPEDWE